MKVKRKVGEGRREGMQLGRRTRKRTTETLTTGLVSENTARLSDLKGQNTTFTHFC